MSTLCQQHSIAAHSANGRFAPPIADVGQEFSTGSVGRWHEPDRTQSVWRKTVPNHLLVNEPSLSTQGIGCDCGKQDADGSTFASDTLPGNCARKALFIPLQRPENANGRSAH